MYTHGQRHGVWYFRRSSKCCKRTNYARHSDDPSSGRTGNDIRWTHRHARKDDLRTGNSSIQEPGYARSQCLRTSKNMSSACGYGPYPVRSSTDCTGSVTSKHFGGRVLSPRIRTGIVRSSRRVQEQYLRIGNGIAPERRHVLRRQASFRNSRSNAPRRNYAPSTARRSTRCTLSCPCQHSCDASADCRTDNSSCHQPRHAP